MFVSSHIFHCRFNENANLPVFKGSLLRGMLGRSLRKASCALTRNECATCLLASRCVYSLAFEVPHGRTANRPGPTPPHPYVLEPPLDGKTIYDAEEPFDVGLTLLGDMTQSLPYFIYAFEMMGAEGIGRNRDELAPFTLERVTTEGQTVYDGATKRLQTDVAPRTLTLEQPPSGSVPQITAQLLTPLRLKHKNSLARELPFHLFVRAMLRRISTLFSEFGQGEPELDYPGLVHRAQAVRTVQDATYWKDWTRYSSRQKQAMQFGGLIGNIGFEGDVGEFLPLFSACRILHVGKQSVFGLGKFTYQAEEAV